MAIGLPSQPLFTTPEAETSDLGVAWAKGVRGLKGQAGIQFKGMGGAFLQELGLEEQGNQWLSDAYASGLLLGMDLNELDKQFKGPRTTEEVSDASGAIAYGLNTLAEQAPVLITQLGPALALTLLRKVPTFPFKGLAKTLTPYSVLATIDWMNTAEVYSNILMEAGESRPKVALGTGALMSTLDFVLPYRVIRRMGKDMDFASYIGKQLKTPASNTRKALAGAIEGGVVEGTTEYIQTIFENMALNYVKENDLMAEFSEAQRLELREARTKGAIVGTFLGGIGSYVGAYRSAKDRADLYRKLGSFGEEPYLPRQMELKGQFGEGFTTYPSADSPYRGDTSSFWTRNLPTMPDLQRFRAPLDEAIGQKINESVMTAPGEEILLGLRDIELRNRAWQDILNRDMEAALDVTDQDQLLDIVDLSQVAVPVERGQTKVGFAPWGAIPTVSEGKRAYEGGWGQIDKQPVITAVTGEPKMKRGVPDSSNVYQNEDYILKRETEIFGAPWVVTDRKTGAEVDRNAIQKVLMIKYAVAAPLGKPETSVFPDQPGVARPALLAAFGVEGAKGAPTTEQRAETQAQRYEQLLAERGVIQAGKGDKVRFYVRDAERDVWYYPEDTIYTLEDIKYGTPKGMTGAQFTAEPPITVVFTLQTEAGKIFDYSIGPTEDNIRIVPRLRSAWKYPQYFAEPISEVEAELARVDEGLDVLTEEQRTELEQYTPEGERLRTVEEEKVNREAWVVLMQDEAFRDRFVQAISNAQIVRGVRASVNVKRYSVSTREEIEQFIADSTKTKRALGLPEGRTVGEEAKLLERQTIEQAEIRAEEREREQLVLDAEATREGMVVGEVVEGVAPVVPAGEAVSPLTEKELAGAEIPVDERPRRVQKEIKEWLALVKEREKELGYRVTSGARDKTTLTSEELASLKAVEWGGHPTVEYTEAKYKPVKPVTKAARAKVVGTAKGAVTTRLTEIAEKYVPPVRRPPETDRGGLPKGAESWLDVIDVDTELRPIEHPNVFEVRVSPEEAEQRGLNPEFFYPFETFGWTETGGLIKVQGNIIHKRDIVEVEEITGRADAPVKGDFIEYFSENYQKARPGEKMEVISAATVPDVIPDWKSARRIFIDNDTGIVIVQRETELKPDEPRFAGLPAARYAYDYEVYLTWYNREEHAIKLDLLKDRLMDIERSVTEAGPVEYEVGRKGRPARKMIPGRMETIDLTKGWTARKEFFDTDWNLGQEVLITLKPTVVERINGARKREGLEPLPENSRFKVFHAFGKGLPIRDAVVSKITAKIISNRLRVVDKDGRSYTVVRDSAQTAFIVKKPTPEQIGVMVPYENLVEQGPEKGARLIDTFSGSIQEEATAMERFMADMFIPQTHAFGRFGENKQKFLDARSKELEDSKNRNALVEFFDGATMEGKIEEVSKDTGTFTLAIPIPKTRAAAKQRFKYIEIDILGYDRIQIEIPKKERTTILPIEGKQSPTDFQHSNVVYVPVLIAGETPVVPTEEATGGSTVQEMAQEIDAPIDEDAVDVVSKEGIDTKIVLNEDVTITHTKRGRMGKQRSQHGKFTEFIYPEEDYFLGGSVRFESDKGAVSLIPIGDITFFYDNPITEKDEKVLASDLKKVDETVKKVFPDVVEEPVVETKVTEPKVVEPEVTEVVASPVSKEIQDKVKPPVADNTTKEIKDVDTTPLGNMPLNQKFKDKLGGEWQVMQQVGRSRTLLKFVGGKSPDLVFKVTDKGKKDTVGFEPGMVIDADSTGTPSGLYLLRYGEGDIPKGATSLTRMGSAVKIEKGKVTEMPNYSIVLPVSADGRFVYNTGLTPKRFKEILGKKIGNMQLARLIKDGTIRIVQNQIDVPNPPVGLVVKAVERNGQVWFITNNIKEDEITAVFAHDIGVHVGLRNVYGDEAFSYILSSARELRDSSPTWRESFAAAESVYDKIRDSVPEEEVADFIAEEAVGYYTEATDPMTDSFWATLLDFFRRATGNIKRYLGIKLSQAEIIAFIRGAIRGTVNGRFDQASARNTERYSVAFEEGGRKFFDDAVSKLRDKDQAWVHRQVASASNLRKKVGTFFNLFKYVPYTDLFRTIRSAMQGKLGAVLEEGEKIKEAFASLSEKEQEQVYHFFTNKDAIPTMIENEKLRAHSVKYKDLILKIGLEAFEKKIIPNSGMNAEQFHELQGAYLPRVFLYHLLHGSKGTTPFGMKASPQWWSEMRVEMDEMKKSLYGEITDPGYLIYRAVTIPQMDMIILDYLEQLSEMKAFGKDKEGKDLPPWVMPEQWTTYSFDDPSTGQTMKRRTTVYVLNEQIANLKLLVNHVKSTPEQVRLATEQIGILEKAVADYYADKGGSEEAALKYFDEKYSTKMFRQLPKGPRFGALSGLWIRKEIYQDILGNSLSPFGEQHFLSKLFSPHGRHAKAVGIWKILKVPLNPPTIARNFVNNTMLLQLFGNVPFHRQPALFLEAFREAYKGVRGTEFTNSVISKNYGLPEKFTAYELAKARGIVASTMIASEIQQMEEVLLAVEREGILSFTTNFQKYWRTLAKKAGGFYQSLEVVGKTVFINDALQHQREHLEEIRHRDVGPDGTPNITIEDAAVLRANEVLFDYSEVSPTVRGLRSSFFGAPFITYQIKVIPQLLKTAAKHPWRFLPYVALFAGAQAAFGSNPFEDDDWDKLMRLAPEWLRENGHGMLMPWKDDNGNWQVADLSYFFPWAGLWDLQGNVRRWELKQGAQEFGLIAPGWQLAVALLQNKDTWRGAQIVDPNGTASDKAMDMFNWMWGMSMPSIITRSGIANMPSLLEAAARMDSAELEGKLFDAAMGRTNRYGDPKKDMTAALLSIVGLGIYPIAPNARARQLRRYTSEIEGYKRSITSARGDITLSKKQEERRVNVLKDKIDEARERRKEHARMTTGIGA